jgi:hypothetical protein
MKLSVSIIWVVFFVVFTIIKGIAKKADKSRGNANTSTPDSGGKDPLQDFFNQLNNVKTAKTTSSPKPEVNSVEDFFKVTTREKNKKTQLIKPQKLKKKKLVKVEPKKSAQVFKSAVKRDPFKIAEEESCCGAAEVISVFSEEEHAFKSKTIGEEGSVDKFGDDVCNKHRYEVKGQDQLKQAIVWAEILKKPKALHKMI